MSPWSSKPPSAPPLIDLLDPIDTAADGSDGSERVRGVRPVPSGRLDGQRGRQPARGLLRPGEDLSMTTTCIPRSAEMLLCDPVITALVVDSLGVSLDMGREIRLANRDQRRALATRDGGCIFPGCDCPASWCDAHHVIWWDHHGPTDISNLALLVQLPPRGLPPPRLDHDRRRRRVVHLDHPLRRHPAQPTPPRAKSHRPPGPPTLPGLTTQPGRHLEPTPNRPRSPDAAVAPARSGPSGGGSTAPSLGAWLTTR